MDDNNVPNNPAQPEESNQPYSQPTEQQPETTTPVQEFTPQVNMETPQSTPASIASIDTTQSFAESTSQPEVSSPSVSSVEEAPVQPTAQPVVETTPLSTVSPTVKKSHRLLWLILAIVVVVALAAFVIVYLK